MTNEKQIAEGKFSLMRILIPGGQLPTFQGYLNIELLAFKRLIDTTEAQTNELLREIDSKYERRINGGEDEEYVIYDMSYDFEIMESYKPIQIKSQLLALYSNFETSLKTLCDYLARDLKKPKTVTDIDSKAYSAASFKYLTKEVGLSPDKFDPYWNKLMAYRAVRNLIAHENSVIHLDGKPFEKHSIVRDLKDIGLTHFEVRSHNDSAYIEVKSFEILQSYVELQDAFFKHLVTELDLLLY